MPLPACVRAFLAGSRWPACSLIFAGSRANHTYTQQVCALIHTHTHTQSRAEQWGTDRPLLPTPPTGPAAARSAERSSENERRWPPRRPRAFLISSYNHAPRGPFGLPSPPLELKSIFPKLKGDGPPRWPDRWCCYERDRHSWAEEDFFFFSSFSTSLAEC